MSTPELVGNGRYRVGRVLSRGGNGQVHVPHQVDHERDLALKILDIPADADPRTHERSHERGGLTARLAPLGIVTGLEIGCDQDHSWVAHELLPGQTLGHAIGERPLGGSEARSAHLRIADALDHARSKGILHREIKPAKVLFAGPDRDKVTPRRDGTAALDSLA